MNKISQMKYEKARRNRSENDYWMEDDVIFGDQKPEFHKSEEYKNRMDLHPELKKMMYSTLYEKPDHAVNNEEEAQNYEDMQDLRLNYFKAKKTFFDDAFENQLTFKTLEFQEKAAIYEQQDKWMGDKIDYMYNYLDFDHERETVRRKFLQEMNKRTTLQDIGESLDKMVIDSKAANWKHYSLAEHWNTQPERASKDYSSEDFKWSGKLLRMMDPKHPLFIDDPKQIAQNDENIQKKLTKVYEQVKYNDEQRDYSAAALTQDEKNEIALFHSMK